MYGLVYFFSTRVLKIYIFYEYIYIMLQRNNRLLLFSFGSIKPSRKWLLRTLLFKNQIIV